MTLDKHIIQSRRHALGLTQEQLARKAGITSTTIGKYERGESKPTGLYIKALKTALEITEE